MTDTPDEPSPVRMVIDNARKVTVPPPADDAGDVPAETNGRPKRRDTEDGLPEDVPIVPLGKDGRLYYVIDATRQLQAIKDTEFGKNKIIALFDLCAPLLTKYWGRYKQVTEKDDDGNETVKQVLTGVHYDQVQKELVAACARHGIYDPVKSLRGSGAWKGELGELIIHGGGRIWRGAKPGDGAPGTGVVLDPGRIDRFVYPAAPPAILPGKDRAPSSDQDGPGAVVKRLLETWAWRRKAIDAHLLLGWLGAAFIGGALKWRPMVWLTGDMGTGKSTVHDLIRLVFDDAIIAVNNVSAAGIWQKTGHASLPVEVDELEADADNRRQKAVIELARQASSGGVILRGGQDHQATEFVARNCFLFSSILIPPLRSQDLSRMAILELDPFPPDAVEPVLEPFLWRAVGTGLLRRMVDGWDRWETTLARYRAALKGKGHSGRGADQWGTLLAAADLLLYDHEPDSDTLDHWAEALKPEGLSELADNVADWRRCLDHLCSAPAEVYRGGMKKPVGYYMAAAAGRVDPDDGPGDQLDIKEAQRALGTIGLRTICEDGVWWLAVANAHQGLQGVFRDTHWTGLSGTNGVWVQAMKRVPGAKPAKSNLRFANVPHRCWLVPMDQVLGEDGE